MTGDASPAARVQRLRIRYRVTASGAALSLREIIRAWEGAARAAGLALVYSKGKRPAPQISVAAPLPLGVTSDCELIDLTLVNWVDPADALQRLRRVLPPGLEATAVQEVGVAAPSLQAQLRCADYEVEVPADGLTVADVQQAINHLLAAEALPWVQQREAKARHYDLRPLVLDLRLMEARQGRLLLAMRLRAEQHKTGRADQVVAALGLPAASRIHRCRLHVEAAQPALLAYRRRGEPDID